MGSSALLIFYELFEEYKVQDRVWTTKQHVLTRLFQARGVSLFITHLKHKPQQQFIKAGIWDLLGADAFRLTVADAIAIVEASNSHQP